jgi:type VI secretion system secreted protein Hcp
MSAFEAFLKIDGIPGESTDSKHRNEIDVLSFHWGIARGTRGRSRVEDFQIVKAVDAASPLLFEAVCAGQTFKEAVFTLNKGVGDALKDTCKMRFQDVFISSVTAAGNAASDAFPMEQVKLGFSSFEMECASENPDGSSGGVVRSSCSPRRGPDE